ncbi:MAG: ABC transporter ATP-binding protein [Clostridiales bacterium]|nr:ABC transporter ATP-binding protein [Clostridiales bacterium]
MDNKNSLLSPRKLKFFGLGKLKPYLGRYKGLFSMLLFSTLASGGLGMITPLFQQYAINHFIVGSTLKGIGAFIGLYVGVLVALAVIDFFGSYSCCKLEMYILRDMRHDAFEKLQTLSVGFFGRIGVGKLHSRIMSDTSSISGIISWDIYQGAFNITYLIGSIIVMLSINAPLALCVIVIIPFVALVSVYFQRKLTTLNRRVREINSEITGSFNESITGVATSKSLAIEDKLDTRFCSQTDNMRRVATRRGHHRSLFFSIIAFASSVALALVLWYGGAITQDGVIMIGTLSLFMTYAQGLMEPVQWSVDAIADLITIKVNIERFNALMETESEVTDTPEVIAKYGDCFDEKRENWEALEGDVEFRDVSFKYPDGDEYVLEHFNLTVPRGSTVAIVGETGAGKSTLVNLICRFYEPTSGNVLIDGKDLRERSAQWLHSNIGYVLQTPHLFSGTVRENLTYGKSDATDEELDEAIRSVHAENVIARLEHGYDSEVGEDGGSLSTGEKQLLSFARAILVNPAIFVLDEATSSIDSVTEKAIQDAIDALMTGRTSFVIAHRLSTIRSADIILVVDDGKIIERGTHEELLKQRGTYFNLYIKQFREDRESGRI